MRKHTNVERVFAEGGTFQATCRYDYDYNALEGDEAADAEVAFNERAWNALASAAGLTDGETNAIEWKWSGYEEGGLTVWVNTPQAARNLMQAGYDLEAFPTENAEGR
jgi:hypothetical protein